MRPVIVIPAYLRAASLQRLLSSLERARIPDGVRVVISLEGGASEDVRAVAESFNMAHLDIEVISRPERLGLRNHILACADEALAADGVIVLEDDLMVDPYFYEYAAAALQHYADDESVAGIALYAPEHNEYAGIPFTPLRNGYSTYPMRVPCSSGQAWTRSQWSRFRAWYARAEGSVVSARVDLPDTVKQWRDTSWKKYFACYLVAEQKDVVYPYDAYSTNYSDAGGAHIPFGSDMFQVRLPYPGRPAPCHRFCGTAAPAIAYDGYMEPCGTLISQSLGLDRSEVEIDLNGIKPLELLRRKRLTVTSKRASEKLATYPLRLRPVELNLDHPVEGSTEAAVWLTSTSAIEEGPRRHRSVGEYSYHSGVRVGSRPIIYAILRGLPNALPTFLRRPRS